MFKCCQDSEVPFQLANSYLGAPFNAV